jgi:3-deoxy-manno-octulosonate cytidylyltransferase (CMP-KDO synthetase)
VTASFRVVIPARYASTRLPGKPLRSIAGRPMIEHVHRRAIESGATEVVVATDDDRIGSAVEDFGGRVRMTRPDHASGTDRIAEVAVREGWPLDAIVVNLQGDEPCMPPAALAAVARRLADRPSAGIATMATPIRDPAEAAAPSVVKVVVDDLGVARWFTRLPLPLAMRHLGIYAFRVSTLRAVTRLPVHPAERAESLEQLRALCAGVEIAVGVLDPAPPPGVDTEDDLARVEKALGP